MHVPILANPDAHDALSVRDLLVIVLAGAALGVGFNALQLQADPARALTWVKGERALAKLELLSHTPPAVTAAGTSAAPAPGSPPEGRGTDPAPAAAAAPDSSAQAHATRAKAAPAHAAAGRQAGAKPHAAAATPAPAAAPAPTPAPPAAVAGEVPVIADSREPVEATLDVVRRLHAAGAALFVDARSAEEFADGHIAGALNVPFDDVFKHPELVRAFDPRGRPVVTYCDGADCELSKSLAFSLIDAGQRKVLVFTGGFPVWQAAGLAVHKGPQP